MVASARVEAALVVADPVDLVDSVADDLVGVEPGVLGRRKENEKRRTENFEFRISNFEIEKTEAQNKLKQSSSQSFM